MRSEASQPPEDCLPACTTAFWAVFPSGRVVWLHVHVWGSIDSEACNALFLHWGGLYFYTRSLHCKLPSLRVFWPHSSFIMLSRWAALLLVSHIAAGLRVQTRAALPSLSRDAPAAHATAPAAQLQAATGAAAAAAAALPPSVAVAAATTEAELDDYFATPHPEFFLALVIHWILWGKFDRRVALAYDFGGLVLFAAEPFFR